ncbi:MAG: serine dehydratase subunit alpha family protein [Spirochaetales bacterium]|nr:serine dehydratase subunit alpha family protein [Spirochaetales bacterium]
MDKTTYDHYLQILHEELIPALGCTEPIAIAYASAKAREVLGAFPISIKARCSGNIIKNVKGVIVPTTGDLKGVEASAILGAVGGNPNLKLETLSDIKSQDVEKTRELLKKGLCTVDLIEGESNLQVIIEMKAENGDTSLVEILYSHTNISRIEKNGKVLFCKDRAKTHGSKIDRSILNLNDIFEFVNTVNLDDVKEILDRQVNYNMAIATEGLEGKYGASVGATLLKFYGNDVKTIAKALPAAGSDARMNGCTLPVVINSGSGNQGMTVSLPIAAYARYLNSDKETEYRALVMSNLIAIYQKNGLGKLSAYCGAVSAAAGAGAGIAYLHNAPIEVIDATITNTLANVSGIVCDGAKASCAAKIASAVDAAQMAYYMASDQHVFPSGEGIVMDDTEKTIKSVGRMGRVGMKSTDVEILKIMLGQ